MISSKADTTLAATFPVYYDSEPEYTGFNFHESWNIRDSLHTTLYQL